LREEFDLRPGSGASSSYSLTARPKARCRCSRPAKRHRAFCLFLPAKWWQLGST